MKQAYIKNGSVTFHPTPAPQIKDGSVKIRVAYSTISAGTEMSAVKDTEKSIFKRALEDPGKVLKVLDILKEHGLKNAKAKVFTVSELKSFGYSVAGQIIETGANTGDLAVGDYVAAAGATAFHAGIITAPKNLVVKIPENSDLKLASTAAVGSIALHGIHRADLKIGEFAIVFGTGLIGLIALQILKASGVRVACVDISADRLRIAKELGAEIIINSISEDPVNAVQNWTGGHGADAVLFLASTSNDTPLSQAFNMCRKKGKVVLIGVSGMNIKRADIYKNEIDLIISTSYGPGRYDDSYEMEGIDYPYGYVRWTENRNIAEYLRLIRAGAIRLDVLNPLVAEIDNIGEAYRQIQANPDKNILNIIHYPSSDEPDTIKIGINPTVKPAPGQITVGLIGTGSFAVNMLLPIIQEYNSKFRLKTIVNRTAEKAINIARQFHAEKVSTDENDIFNDPEIDLVVIVTRHDSHASLILKALENKKHVYAEKPLAISLEQLEQIEHLYKQHGAADRPLLMIGFNRRFSPYIHEIKKHLDDRTSPVFMHYRMNAGYVPYDAWIHGSGGRIIGEGCHIVDLMKYLAGNKTSVKDITVNQFHPEQGKFRSDDNKSITLNFEDGSVAVIDYFSCGSKELSKEYLEVHFDNKSFIMDDYKELKSFGIKTNIKGSSISLKGHKEEWLALYEGLNKGYAPIDFQDIAETSRISIIAAMQ